MSVSAPSGGKYVMGTCVRYSVNAQWCDVSPGDVYTGVAAVFSNPSGNPCANSGGAPYGPYPQSCGRAYCTTDLTQQINGIASFGFLWQGANNLWFTATAVVGSDNWVCNSNAPSQINRRDSINSTLTQIAGSTVAYPGDTLSFKLVGKSPVGASEYCLMNPVAAWDVQMLDVNGQPIGSPSQVYPQNGVIRVNSGDSVYEYQSYLSLVVPNGQFCGQQIRVRGRIYMANGFATYTGEEATNPPAAITSPFSPPLLVATSIKPSLALVQPNQPPAEPELFLNECVFPYGTAQVNSCGCRTFGHQPESLDVSFAQQSGNGNFTFTPPNVVVPCGTSLNYGVSSTTPGGAGGSSLYRLSVTDMNGVSPPQAQLPVLRVSNGYASSVVVSGTDGAAVTLRATNGDVQPSTQTQTLAGGSSAFTYRAGSAGPKVFGLKASLACYEPFPGPGTPAVALLGPGEARVDANSCAAAAYSIAMVPVELAFGGTVKFGSKINEYPATAGCDIPPSDLGYQAPLCSANVSLSRDGVNIASLVTGADGSFTFRYRPPDIQAHSYALVVGRQGFLAGVHSQVILSASSCAQPSSQALELYLNQPSCPVPGSNPVDPVSGRRTLSVTDLHVPGRAGLDFSFTRLYRMDTGLADLGLGPGWTHNWMMQLKDDGHGSVLVLMPDGDWHTLVPDGPGRYKGVPGFFYTLEFSANRWMLRDTQGTRYEFDPFRRLQGVTDRFGNHIELGRDELGRVNSITDSGGRVFSLGYDPDSGHLVSLTAPQPDAPHGRVWTFTYSPQGDLFKVDGPGSGTGYHAAYGYDARHWMNGKDEPKAPAGLKHMDLVYDGSGRVTAEKRKDTGETVVAMDYGLAGSSDNQYTVNGYSTRVLVDAYSRSAGRQVGTDSTFEAWSQDNQGATERRDFRGNATTTTYYPGNRGEVHTVTDPSGLVTEYVYDSYGLGVVTERHVYHKDRPSVRRDYISEVNSLGQVLSYQDGAPDRVTTYQYEPQGYGQWTSQTDPDGTVLVREFWPDGQVRKLSNQTAGLATDYSYDGWGRLKTQVNEASGLSTTYTYDGSGHAVETDYQDAHGSSGVTAAYDEDERLRSRTDEDGGTVSYSYSTDRRDNVVTETGPGGTYVRRSVFDPFKNELQSSGLEGPDGLGGQTRQWTDYGYEQAGCCSAQGRVNKVTVRGAQVGSLVKDLSSGYKYDLDGNRILVQSPLSGHDQGTGYDELSRVLTQTLGSGAEARTVTYHYNDFGERDGLTDGKNQHTDFHFDAHGQLDLETPPGGSSLSFGYTSGGKPNRKTDRLNRTWNAHYDGGGRLLHEDFAGPNGTVNHDFIYGQVGDGSDQLLRAADPSGVTEYTYGHRGRLDESIHHALGRRLKRHYDPAGHLSGLDLEDASGALLRASVYVPDALGRVGSYTDWGGNRFDYRYNAAGQLRQVRLYPKGAFLAAWTGVYTYDDAGQLLNISYRKGSAGLLIAKVDYGYDEAGNRTAKTSLGASASYGYNTLNELTSDNNSGDSRGSQVFGYDGAGNRSGVTWPTGQQAYGVSFGLNHLDSVAKGPQGAFQYGYDAEGNRNGKYVNETDGHGEMEGSSSYVWDGKNRLSSVSLPDGRVVSYTYDFQNRRVARTLGTETRNYLYGEDTQLVEETANGNRVALYGWGANGLDSRTDGNGRSLFYLKDGLGSVIAVVDAKASIVQSYEYSAFGECLSGKDAVNAFRFGGGFGGQTDDATGLIYFWNRWYDPQVGRWVSEDPERFDGLDSNLYRYGANDPELNIDPTGLWSQPIHKHAIAVALGDLDSSIVTALQAAQATIDSIWSGGQGSSMSFTHAMRAKGQSVEDAHMQANNFVKDNLRNAQCAYFHKEYPRAYRLLGYAMHTMQDSTSPAHIGFQEWDLLDAGGVIRHHEAEKNDPGPGSNLYMVTRDMWEMMVNYSPLPGDMFIYGAP